MYDSSQKFTSLINADVPRTPFYHPTIANELRHLGPTYQISPRLPLPPPDGFISRYCPSNPVPQLDFPTIECTITSGPDTEDLFKNLRFAYDHYGDPIFLERFSVQYNRQIQSCPAHLYGLEYDTEQPRSTYRLKGAISIKISKHTPRRHYFFTALYSAETHHGTIWIHTLPISTSILKKPTEPR